MVVSRGFATSEDKIKNALNFVQFLASSIDYEKKISSQTMKESVPLQDFVAAHCNMSDYVFQLKTP